MSHQAAAALVEKAMRQARRFLLQRPKAEARRAGLRDDEAAVLEQQLARLCQAVFRRRRIDVQQDDGSRGRLLLGHVQSLR